MTHVQFIKIPDFILVCLESCLLPYNSKQNHTTWNMKSLHSFKKSSVSSSNFLILFLRIYLRLQLGYNWNSDYFTYFLTNIYRYSGFFRAVWCPKYSYKNTHFFPSSIHNVAYSRRVVATDDMIDLVNF